MGTGETRHWPFDVMLPAAERTRFQNRMILFLKSTYETGLRPYITYNESEIGFDCMNGRSTTYVRRGGYGESEIWEPWLYDRETTIRLGPSFGFGTSKMMTLNGFDDLTMFTLRWMNGQSISDSLIGITVTNMQKQSFTL